MIEVGSTPKVAGGLRLRRLALVSLFFAGIVAGGIFVWTFLRPDHPGTAADAPAAPIARPVGAQPGDAPTAAADSGTVVDRAGSGAGRTNASIGEGRRNAIVQAAERVGPSVVSISVMQTRYVQGRSADPFGFFDRYLPGPILRERVPTLGSGVIIDKAGVILTNEHVVHAAEQIKVTLTDGRTFDGKVVGSDPNYDLAVVKVSGADLPSADLGNSDDILVGEWAIAIGNPFGFLLNDYQPSVSVGVISAKGRDIKPNEGTTGIYKNMIQTDAAINPGNSGGPLVNGEGKVIGINTFIFTESGGSVGIGFAIPINTAVRVVKEILQFGEVRGVWTGIAIKEITPYIAAYYNIADPRGLLIVELEDGSPADRAGVSVGDIIRKVDGEPVWTNAQAFRLIFGASAGDVITLTIEREKQLRDVRVRLEAGPRRAVGRQG
jgi:serine protease Do